MSKIKEGDIVRFKDELNHIEIVKAGNEVENDYIVLDVSEIDGVGEVCKIICSTGRYYWQTHEQWHCTYLFESISTPVEEED